LNPFGPPIVLNQV